ncbi:MAG TPA: hypothetical protein VK973_15860 [Arenicellales bacterium]|nr:hypothetical protein [Arenicellales bacterium]
MASGGSGIARIPAQVLVYAACAALLGYFSASPEYTRIGPDVGVVKLSFSHAGAPKSECIRRTQEELDELAPNMRRPLDCPRGRVALLLELEIDGEPIYRDSLPPSGLAGDGASTVYQQFKVPVGQHRLVARLRDSRRQEGFDWTLDRVIDIGEHENVVIDFQTDTGGFKIL